MEAKESESSDVSCLLGSRCFFELVWSRLHKVVLHHVLTAVSDDVTAGLLHLRTAVELCDNK